MACVLRRGNTHASHRSVAVLEKILEKLKWAYRAAQILLRLDAGFCRTSASPIP
ncbi:MAG: hypothetical protein GTO40_23895 [Deltaproteobacteria bacterium]|nr:hypothetical protein [Deltaproteobacteria bacterium]